MPDSQTAEATTTDISILTAVHSFQFDGSGGFSGVIRAFDGGYYHVTGKLDFTWPTGSLTIGGTLPEPMLEDLVRLESNYYVRPSRLSAEEICRMFTLDRLNKLARAGGGTLMPDVAWRDAEPALVDRNGGEPLADKPNQRYLALRAFTKAWAYVKAGLED